jgi:hypothetical protein
MTDVQATGETRPRGPRGPERHWFALGVIAAAAPLITALDATIVNIALPSAQRALGFSDAQRQWEVTAYTVCANIYRRVTFVLDKFIDAQSHRTFVTFASVVACVRDRDRTALKSLGIAKDLKHHWVCTERSRVKEGWSA